MRSTYPAWAGDASARDLSPLPKHATYNVGKNIKVRTVATSSPPMIAKAMGPQNTVGAMGIMPRTVEMAVSTIGLNLALLASIAA